MTAERAVTIERVSTGKQTPGLQSPELAARVEGRGYDLQRTFRLTASARKGKQQAVLDEILDGARRGEWSVVLCVAIDRVERRGVFALRTWISKLHEAGARLESTSRGEEWLSDLSDELVWSIRLDLEADRAKREADLRTERTRRGHAEVDRQHSGRVKLPLGWRYHRIAKYRNTIVVDEDAMKVVRAAFAMAASGATLQQIARYMKEHGYPRTPAGVGVMLRMTCYSTGELYVPKPVSVTPAVAAEVQAQAIANLEARRTYSGPRNRTTDASDYAGRIFCYEHLLPLHRWFGPPRKDGSRKRYYKSRGCGCGVFEADGVDELVETLGWIGDEPETEMVLTGDSSVRLAQIEREMTQVFRKRPGGWVAALAALEVEQKQLEAASGGWERRETGREMGQVWKSMSRAEKRRYLERQAETGNWRFLVRKVQWPDGKVVVKVSRRWPGAEHVDKERWERHYEPRRR